MRPDEIVVGGVYRGNGSDQLLRVKRIGTGYVEVERVALGDLIDTEGFASWATERIDKP